MINKLICWLLGHKLRGKHYYPEYETVDTRYFDWIWLDRCTRCGEPLSITPIKEK